MKLPTVEQRGINPGYTDVNVTPESFGAGIAKGVVDASTVVGNIAGQEILQNDRQSVLGITSVASKMYTEKVIEYTSKLLADAKGITAQAEIDFAQIQKDALKETTNPRQARLVQEALQHQAIAHLGTTRAHEAHQFKATTVTYADDMLRSAIDSVKPDPMNEETAWVAKHNAAASAANKYEGLTAEQMTQRKAEAVSGVTSSQLQSLLEQGKTADFLVLYPQVKNELVGNDADKFSKYATETVDLTVVQKLTGDFYSSNPDNMNAALDSARSVLTGKQENDVVSALKTRYAEVEAGKTQLQRDDIDRAKQQFRDGGYRVSAIARDVYARINEKNPEILISLDSLQEQHASVKRATIQSDAVAYQKWWEQTDDEKAAPSGDPLLIAPLMSESDYQTMVRYRAEILANIGGFDRASEKKTWTEGELGKLITSRFADVYKNQSGNNANRFKKYDGAVRDAIKNYQALNNGAYPSYEDIEKEITYQLVEGARVGQGLFGGDTKGRRFQTRLGGEEFRPYDVSAPGVDPLDVVNTVPPADSAEIATRLRAKGKTVSREEILRVYKEYLDKQNAVEPPAQEPLPAPTPAPITPNVPGQAPPRVKREP